MSKLIKLTFWELVNTRKRKIEIPIIQRDYAQGREDERASQVRCDIVTSLCGALKNNADESLDFGLVYGSLEKASSGCLAPLDGQQRLTTLFLLHWYLAQFGVPRDAREGDAREERRMAAESLKRFSYRTRVSAREFCEQLAQSLLTPPVGNIEGKLSEYIQNQSWFFLSWKKDPTVAGMLIMLDEINSQLKGEQGFLHVYWKKMTNIEPEKQPPVVFQFLESTDFGLTDELYIKMNARGRPLTDFERIKAWMEKRFDSADSQLNGSEWTVALDKEWTDFFWKLKEDSDKKQDVEIDAAYLRFLTGVALNRLITGQKDGETLKQFIEQITDEKQFLDTKALERLFTHDTLNYCFKMLDAFCSKQVFNQISGEGKVDGKIVFEYGKQAEAKLSGFRRFILREATYQRRALVHAMCAHLNRHDNFESTGWLDSFYQWMRVARNLIANSSIGTPLDFFNIINSVEQLAQFSGEAGGNIHAFLAARDGQFKLTGLSPQQMREEILKSRLIQKDTAWEVAFLEAENSSLFRGQIRSIIEISATDKEGALERFRAYAERATALFSDESKLGENPFLLQRALLAIGDYLPRVDSNYGFCKNENEWRNRFFIVRNEMPDAEESKRLDYLRKLLDKVQGEHEKDCLTRIIEAQRPDDWRALFIEYPNNIEVCGKCLIRWQNEGANIMLLRGERLSGWHAELRTYTFFHHWLRGASAPSIAPFKADYNASSNNDWPYAYLVSGNVRIEIRYALPSRAAQPHYAITAKPSVVFAGVAEGDLCAQEESEAYVFQCSSSDETMEMIQRLVRAVKV